MLNFKEVNFGFLDEIISDDLEKGYHKEIITRFPPEPNGYLHIGHAKAISVNFGLAAKYNGKCHLRFDDTNPEKEDSEYVEAIKRDIRWLGFDLDDNIYYASEYFHKMHDFAVKLIKEGLAYVCQLSPEEMREYRGTLTTPGKDSPYRNRDIEDNIRMFQEMKDGIYDEGSMVLRLKIDMSSPNINMRDPIIYRILKKEHHHIGEGWNIYPMYDYAHPIEDALENITHSLCSLEFEDHRPLYDYILKNLDFIKPPKQREFARLNINYTVMSKRKLLALVEEGLVDGWDDPRMPTISGLRRRGYPKDAIIKFVIEAGIAKSNSIVDIAQLEAAVREELNYTAIRGMAVVDPIKVIVTNFEKNVEWLEVDINPEQIELGKRKLPFTKELYIEKEDFSLNPPKGYRRLFVGNEVRFKGAYYLKCEDYKLDDNGEVSEVYCTYDESTKGGWTSDGRKVKGTIQWISTEHAIPSEFRLFDRLFKDANPEKGDFRANINPASKIIKEGFVEDFLKDSDVGNACQFLRNGYFALDQDSNNDRLVFNRVVSLKDSFNK
jgi:glutaminyl-tRNA synthetase